MTPALVRTWAATFFAATFLATIPRDTVKGAALDPVTEWSIAASTAAVASGMPPLRTPITLAMLHLAMYDAVIAVTADRQPYAVHPTVIRPASATAAAILAGYRVLLGEFPSQRPAIDAKYQQLQMLVPDGVQKANGAAVGTAVAQQLLALRVSDGRNLVVAYLPGSGPGAWVPTPRAFLPATTAFLAYVAPFTMESPSQFRPGGPPPLESMMWAHDYNEVKDLGRRDSSKRTAEQTATALFWEPLAGTVWPASIRRLAQEQALDLPTSARFQAAAFAAFADSLIACWDAKFYFNFWRPVTAIQRGAIDQNARTDADSAWEPLAITPNFPEYPSGHTCATGAVAHVLEDFFVHDVVIPARNIVSGEERFYPKASGVVDEVIEARMLLGLHFRTADEDGAHIGNKIARQIRSRWFKPRE